jgi:hypothetical protein
MKPTIEYNINDKIAAPAKTTRNVGINKPRDIVSGIPIIENKIIPPKIIITKNGYIPEPICHHILYQKYETGLLRSISTLPDLISLIISLEISLNLKTEKVKYKNILQAIVMYVTPFTSPLFSLKTYQYKIKSTPHLAKIERKSAIRRPLY